MQKFHRYLYGRKFTLITDHKPLTTILGPKKGIPSLAAARLQRWAILLSAYDYNIHYKCTTEHGNADGLSRLPLPSTTPTLDAQTVTTFNTSQVEALPVTFQDIQRATRRDPTLGKVYRYVLDGWPSHVPDELKRYKNRETELSTENGCLMWGIRVHDHSTDTTFTSPQISSCQSSRSHKNENNCSQLFLVGWFGQGY